MLDRITDLSVREVHDAVRQHLVATHTENSLPVRVFDATIDVLLDGKHDVELEAFLQSQWDTLN